MSCGNQIDRRAVLKFGGGALAGDLLSATAGLASDTPYPVKAGRLFSFDDDKGFRSLGKAHLAPVGPIAVTEDGRIFGFCGTEMANLFCYDPASGRTANLGVAASVLEQRRYGYQFGDAVTGPDGEIVFGEDDNGGHLWLYFPKVAGARA
jgi:hypothetical protein